MASVLAEKEVWPARKNGLLPSVRPVTTLLATGIVWITGLLVACSIAAGYLRQQVLSTTADELRRLDTVLAETTTRSLQGIDLTLASLADRVRRQGDTATVLRQAIDQSRQFDAIALIGADGKLLRSAGRWPDARALSAAAGPNRKRHHRGGSSSGFRRQRRHDASSERVGSAGVADRGHPATRRLSPRPLGQPRRGLDSCRLDTSGLCGR